MLSYFYGVKMGYLIADKRLDDAIEIGLQREKLLDKTSRQAEVRADILDQQFAYVYSKLAYLFHRTGDKERAAAYYKKYQSTDASATVDGRFDIAPYLLALGQYQTVLDNCLDFKKMMHLIISMESGSLNHELLKFFEYDSSVPTGSAFYQQRSKLSVSAFRHLLKEFNLKFPLEKFRGKYYLIACDGSEFNIARNLKDADTFHARCTQIH